MARYLIKDTTVLTGAVTINSDGSNTYNSWNWVPLANTVWSPVVELNPGGGFMGTIQLSVVGANASTTVIELQASLDGIAWFTLTGSPITLTGAGATAHADITQVWSLVRARTTTVSAATTLTVMVQG
jgi:hypothetical protein